MVGASNRRRITWRIESLCRSPVSRVAFAAIAAPSPTGVFGSGSSAVITVTDKPSYMSMDRAPSGPFLFLRPLKPVNGPKNRPPADSGAKNDEVAVRPSIQRKDKTPDPWATGPRDVSRLLAAGHRRVSAQLRDASERAASADVRPSLTI